MAQRKASLAERVVASFGGVSALAKALGHNSASTVGTWSANRRIPAWRFAEIRAAAARRDVALPPDFPPEAKAA